MTVNVKTNNNGKSLVEIGNISNPNLLINPDFKINQRGQTSYDFSTKSGYTVDRWHIYHSKLTLNSDNTITVDFQSSGSFDQQLETVLNEQHTASINITKITGSIRFYIGTSKFITITSPGIYTITHDTDITQVSLYNPTSNNTAASCTVKWVKLEKGPIATQFVSPVIAAELTKCQRYYQCVNLDCFPAILIDNFIFCSLHGLVTMRAKPSIKISKNITYTGYYGTTAFQADISSFYTETSTYFNSILLVYKNNKNTGANRIVGSFTDSIVYLDAEIY